MIQSRMLFRWPLNGTKRNFRAPNDFRSSHDDHKTRRSFLRYKHLSIFLMAHYLCVERHEYMFVFALKPIIYITSTPTIIWNILQFC